MHSSFQQLHTCLVACFSRDADREPREGVGKLHRANQRVTPSVFSCDVTPLFYLFITLFSFLLGTPLSSEGR